MTDENTHGNPCTGYKQRNNKCDECLSYDCIRKKPCALSEPASERLIWRIGAYLLGLSLIVMLALPICWRGVEAAIYKSGAQSPYETVVTTLGLKDFFSVEVQEKKKDKKIKKVLLPDTIALTMVLLCGMFGGLIHSIRSYYYHVIQGTLRKSQATKYLLRPFTGAIIAVVFYFALRAGLGSSSDDGSLKGNSLVFYCAIAGLVGMFTDQTVAKLKRIAEAIFTPPSPTSPNKKKQDSKV